MKGWRRTAAAAAVAVVVAAGSAGAQEAAAARGSAALTGGFSLYVPNDDATYEFGLGLEGQLQYWPVDAVGVALAMGAVTWQADESGGTYRQGGSVMSGSIEGTVSLLVGPSLLVRPVHTDAVSLTLEAGVRYVLVQSDIEIDVAYVNDRGDAVYARDTVEIGNGFVGVAGAALGVRVAPELQFYAAAGAQFDISKGDVEWLGYSIGENELAAVYGQLGFILDL